MYRLLIVDDEEMITDGLYETFAGQNLDLDLCKAYSGKEALGWLQRTRVDIVLSDIRMPGIDGMQLLEIISQQWPHCRVIFLTGYSDFDSVYQAIQTPGVQYLLKSEGYPKVIQAVKAAIAELEEGLRRHEIVQQALDKLNTLEVLARGEYFRHLLHGVKPALNLKDDFRKLNIPLNADQPIFVVQGELSSASCSESYCNRQESSLTVTLFTESFLSDYVRCLGFIDRFGDLVWLIQPLEGKKSPMEEGTALPYLEGQFELIQRACMDNLELSVAITLGDSACEWNKLPLVYDKIKRQRQRKAGDGALMVQTVILNPFNPTSYMQERSPREKSDYLTSYLEAGRRHDFFQLFDQLTLIEKDMDAAYLLELYYTVALSLLSYINRWELEDQMNGLSALMRRDEFSTWEESFQFLRTTAKTLFDLRSSGERNRAVEAIAKIRAYIEDHLNEDLSLVRLAGYIHFNPSYLSRLFKQESGVTLSEYIEGARIERAKQLLKRNDLKVQEIGYRVGYEASQSFTRFFKKATGLTPQEYRDASRAY
ncbi:helix-turn-helix domain-containing protein [Paenibacillus xylaniclasticus]|uniref:helix-turn-helix domain-containing protein n=1 Tax=Paenibacillus xylaniclasticus TaxID=588083 RepID=UPI000FD70D77|nr:MULTISPECIES: helix-turn-helix domain-containing protein [Paenibacillus]GFN33041.1 hypothetical protein PCURB6_33010 [Paenibacillus curdlanolyticus]